MKLLLENWNRYLLNEISFDKARERLKDKVLTKWIKGMAFDEETKTMTLNPEEIEAARVALAELLLELVPSDLDNGDREGPMPQKGTSLEWLISIGINDPDIKGEIYDEAVSMSGETSSGMAVRDMNQLGRKIRGALERYWHTHDYSDQKDIFSIETWGALSWAADKAKTKFDAAQEDKDYKDPEKGIEVFRDDDKWRIYALHNKGAACHYGKGTEWCTAAPGLSYFEEYYEPDDPLFYFESKGVAGNEVDYPEGTRFQFHFGSGQFMDEGDIEVEDAIKDELIILLGQTDATNKYPKVKHSYELIRIMKKAGSASTTPEELSAMAHKYAGLWRPNVMRAIMANEDLPEEALVYIAMNDDDVRRETIRHHRFPAAALEDMALSDSAEIRLVVAASGKLSPEMLTKLSMDEKLSVRTYVAMDKSTPRSTLTKLAQDAMADGPADNYEDVGRYLFKNASLPPELFIPLLKRAKDLDETRVGRMNYIDVSLNYAGRNPALTAAAMEEILDTYSNWDLRESHFESNIIALPNMSVALLWRLSESDDKYTAQLAREFLVKRGEDVGLSILAENFRRFLK